MTNDDLKRFYPINTSPERNNDFVRYNTDGGIYVEKDAVLGNEVVNYRTLIKHAGGPGADLNYLGAWTTGSEYHEYDLVYVDLVETRQFYMCIVDIASSTVAPNLDNQHWSEFLEVNLPRQLAEFPNAGINYVNKIFQYVGTTDANYTNGYFYKCVETINSYTVVGGEFTYYCASLPNLGTDVSLYEDITLQTLVTGKVLYHMTTGYVIRESGQDDIDAECSQNVSYSWSRINTQPVPTGRIAVTIDSPSSATSGTLSDAQLTTLTASNDNYLVFDGEFYYLADKKTSDGYLVYSHCGEDNSHNFFMKCITVTISTLGWVKTTKSIE